ncbi:MAG TPA: mechanosensitive ion channel family protein [Acidimicrobiales bacterium]|nr:mechanosensitive ion channel family protein [Acidimicrobiales bacterium]
MSVLGAATRPILAHPVTPMTWAVAGAVLVGSILVGQALRMVVERDVHRRDSERTAAVTLGRLGSVTAGVIGLLVALAVLHVHPGALLGALGIGGLAVAFAAQSILANFFASILIQVRRPFRRGDQVSVHGIDGILEGIDFRTVLLRTFDGERVRVPSSLVLNAPIVNYTTHGSRRTTVKVGISYDADLPATRELLRQAARQVDGVLHHPAPEVWVTALGDYAVELAVQTWHVSHDMNTWRTRNDLLLAVKSALDGAGVAMPYPIRTVEISGVGGGGGGVDDAEEPAPVRRSGASTTPYRGHEHGNGRGSDA